MGDSWIYSGEGEVVDVGGAAVLGERLGELAVGVAQLGDDRVAGRQGGVVEEGHHADMQGVAGTPDAALAEDIGLDAAVIAGAADVEVTGGVPCPYGVNIPGNFTYYNDAVKAHIIPLPEPSAPDYAERQQKFIEGYRKALPEAEKWARACQDCEECLSKCPQQIRIPNQMGRIVETLRKRG